LESEFSAVDVSTDGEQARAMAWELDFDLVVLDLNLPRLDGVTILRFLRTRKPSMPILVLTGRAQVDASTAQWVVVPGRRLRVRELRNPERVRETCLDDEMKSANLFRDGLAVFGNKFETEPARAWTLASTFHGRVSSV
jgi:CheY-like chemotaxis protein